MSEVIAMRHSRKSSDSSLFVRTHAWQSAVIALLLVITASMPLFLADSYFMHVLILAFVYMVVTASFRVVVISGQLSIAHAAFMGVGAYIAGMASVWLDWPSWVTIPAGAVGATLLGSALAYPFARLRRVYYAMGTLFLGYVIINLFTAGGKWTGSTSGVAGIEPLFSSRIPYYYVFLGVALVSFAVIYRFEHSRIGMTLKAVAQSHLVASSVGVNERRWRILAVGFACFFAGLMGALYAHYNTVASPTSFGLSASLWIIMYTLVGGSYSSWGPVVGVTILMVVPEFFRDLRGYLPYVSAVILVVVAFALPGGLTSIPRLIKDRASRSHSAKEMTSDAP